MNGCIANELTSTSARGSIHGHIHWDNGRHTDFIYARIVNGEERKADFIEFDGERYERVKECGIKRSYYYDEYDQYEFEFSCGHSVDMYDKEPPNFCPLCGAKVKVGE